jgi:membrane protein insertase Oxa1/YidC/SpoIIIJ
MNNKKNGSIVITMVGILMIILSFLYYGKFSFIISGLGIALIGISIELYMKDKKDTITENGKSRNTIDMYDERTVFINAKSGEIVNYIMDSCTIIALIIAKLLNVSLVGIIIILSLIIIRLVISPIVKNYYEMRV